MNLIKLHLGMSIVSYVAFAGSAFMYGLTLRWGWLAAAIIWGFNYALNRVVYTRKKNEYRRRARDYQRASTGTTDSAYVRSVTFRATHPRTSISYEVCSWPSLIFGRANVKERNQEDPVKGWKAANTYYKPETGEVLFTPVVQSIPYGPEEYAKCTFVEEVYRRLDIQALMADGWEVSHDHGTIPSEECTCGFYCMDSDRMVDPVTPTEWASMVYGNHPELEGYIAVGSALLEVELYGKIVKGKHGSRGQYQRVLCVYTYPPEGHGLDHPLPNVQVDWKWITGEYEESEPRW